MSSGLGLFNEAVLAERGFDQQTYVAFLSGTAVVGLLGQLGCGWLTMRWSMQRLLGIAMFIYAVAIAALPLLTTHAQLWFFAVLIGLSGGMVTVIFFAVWRRAFGPAHLGRIQGAAGEQADPGRDLVAEDLVPSELVLTRAATRTLARHDRTTLEDLATPHAPRLATLQRAREALGLQRATPAEGLRDLEVGRRVREPEVRVVLAARQLRVDPDGQRGQRAVERSERQSHPCSLSRSSLP